MENTNSSRLIRIANARIKKIIGHKKAKGSHRVINNISLSKYIDLNNHMKELVS